MPIHTCPIASSRAQSSEHASGLLQPGCQRMESPSLASLPAAWVPGGPGHTHGLHHLTFLSQNLSFPHLLLCGETGLLSHCLVCVLPDTMNCMEKETQEITSEALFFLSTCKMKVTFGCQRALRLMTEIPHSRTGSAQPRCSTLTVIFIPTTCEQCYCTCSPDGKTEAPRS